MPRAQVDLVTGWVNEANQEVWGRPVDLVVDQKGNMLISDDNSGTIYKLSAEVQVYKDTNFSGVSQSLPIGVYRVIQGNLSIVGNDTISSLRVPTNLKVRVCQNDITPTNNAGLCRDYGPGDYSYVGDDLNDQISYIDVQPS